MGCLGFEGPQFKLFNVLPWFKYTLYALFSSVNLDPTVKNHTTLFIYAFNNTINS